MTWQELQMAHHAYLFLRPYLLIPLTGDNKWLEGNRYRIKHQLNTLFLEGRTTKNFLGNSTLIVARFRIAAFTLVSDFFTSVLSSNFRQVSATASPFFHGIRLLDQRNSLNIFFQEYSVPSLVSDFSFHFLIKSRYATEHFSNWLPDWVSVCWRSEVCLLSKGVCTDFIHFTATRHGTIY